MVAVVFFLACFLEGVLLLLNCFLFDCVVNIFIIKEGGEGGRDFRLYYIMFCIIFKIIYCSSTLDIGKDFYIKPFESTDCSCVDVIAAVDCRGVSVCDQNLVVLREMELGGRGLCVSQRSKSKKSEPNVT